MKKCCDSCRYFQKRDLPGAGWCRHPERIDLNSDLVLVRASQLDCRRQWDQDLWEPIPLFGGETGRFERKRELGPVPPVTPSEITWIVKASRANEGSAAGEEKGGEDRVVGTAPSPIRHIPKALLNRPPAAIVDTGAGHDVPGRVPDRRQTILRAREVTRARVNNRIRPTADPLPATDVTNSNAAHSSSSSGSAPDETRETTTTPPLALADLITEAPPGESPAIPSPATFPIEIDVMAETPTGPAPPPTEPPFSPRMSKKQTFIPLPPERDMAQPSLRLIYGLKTRPTAETVLEPEEVPFDVVAINNVHPAHEDVVVAAAAAIDPNLPARRRTERKEARRPKGSPFTFRSRWVDARHEPKASRENPPIEPLSDELVTVAAGEIQNQRRGERSNPSDRAVSGLLPDLLENDAGISWIPATENVDNWEYLDDPMEVADEPVELEIGVIQVPDLAPSVEIDDDVVVYDDLAGPVLFDPVIDGYVIAPEVPRMCQTCSAFRPADDGARGWCSNGWAFDHRQFVGATTVPCASSIGDWWLPSNDYWDDGHLERLGAPAPLYDRDFAPKVTPARQRPVQRRSRWR